jgi:polysaccharide chain length determinant protein (PEP-CTERM system associated)
MLWREQTQGLPTYSPNPNSPAMQELLLQVTTILRGMWKFRWIGLGSAWVAAAIGAVVVWNIPNQFQASARIFVDTDSILKPLMSGLAVQPNIDQQISMLSRTLISRPNLEKLVRMADLDLKADADRGRDKLIDDLTKAISIRTAGANNLYFISYSDMEPERAKRVVQGLVSIFVESGLGASRKDTDSAKTFLTEQIKSFEAKLEEAEARLKEFRLRNIERQNLDGKSSADRMGEVAAQLEAARLQLREAERARDAARQSSFAHAQVAGAPLPTPETGPSTGLLATPELDSRIDGMKRNLDGLLQRYTERHPDVLSTRRLLADLEQQRKREVEELRKRYQGQPGAPGQANDSPVLQELRRMLASAEVQVATLQARVGEYASRMANVRESLKTAPQIEAEAAQLNRDYQITKRGYEDLVARRQSAVMSGDLDVASGMAEFRLIDPPRVSPKPVSPNRVALLAGVLLAALGIGASIAFVASQLRPTFASGEELRIKTGLPLLGVVTRLVSDEERQQQRRQLMGFVFGSGGLVGVFCAALITMTLVNR